MGFGETASSLIMFIAVLVVAAGLTVIFTSQLNEIALSSQQKQDFLANKIRTDIIIDYAYYNSTATETLIYVKNTGSTSLDIEDISLFFNDNFFRVNSTQAPAEVESDTDTINVGALDNNEVLKVIIDGTLSSGTHNVRVVSPYQTVSTYIFST